MYDRVPPQRYPATESTLRFVVVGELELGGDTAAEGGIPHEVVGHRQAGVERDVLELDHEPLPVTFEELEVLEQRLERVHALTRLQLAPQVLELGAGDRSQLEELAVPDARTIPAKEHVVAGLGPRGRVASARDLPRERQKRPRHRELCQPRAPALPF